MDALVIADSGQLLIHVEKCSGFVFSTYWLARAVVSKHHKLGDCLMVLEAASLRSGYRQGWFLLREGGKILCHTSPLASGGLLATCGIPWLIFCFNLTWLSDAQRADKTLFLGISR